MPSPQTPIPILGGYIFIKRVPVIKQENPLILDFLYYYLRPTQNGTIAACCASWMVFSSNNLMVIMTNYRLRQIGDLMANAHGVSRESLTFLIDS
jgi:hypothetical protein